MAIPWRISDGLVWLESKGEVGFMDWRSAVDAALTHSDYRLGMGVVHDWRGLDTAPSAEEIRRRAGYVQGLGPIRWALVVGGDAGYGMGRMAEILTNDVPIGLRTFRDLREAEAWARGESKGTIQ